MLVPSAATAPDVSGTGAGTGAGVETGADAIGTATDVADRAGSGPATLAVELAGETDAIGEKASRMAACQPNGNKYLSQKIDLLVIASGLCAQSTLHTCVVKRKQWRVRRDNSR